MARRGQPQARRRRLYCDAAGRLVCPASLAAGIGSLQNPNAGGLMGGLINVSYRSATFAAISCSGSAIFGATDARTRSTTAKM